MTSLHLEETNESLDSVADEVSSELVHLFLVGDELRGGHAVQVAALALDHDWKITDLLLDEFGNALVDAAAEGHGEGRGVGELSLAALVGEKTSIGTIILLHGVADAGALDPEADDGAVLILDLGDQRGRGERTSWWGRSLMARSRPCSSMKLYESTWGRVTS